MIQDYLIIHKKILPDNFLKVVQARKLLEDKKCRSVQEAIEEVGISRTTYYKYKDYIFLPSQDLGQRFTVALKLKDIPGILSKILTIISEKKVSIITINQDIPINGTALVSMTLSGTDMKGSIDEFINALKEIPEVYSVSLISME